MVFLWSSYKQLKKFFFKEVLIKPLVIIINQSLKAIIFPDKLKIAEVNTVFKKYNNTQFKIIDQFRFYFWFQKCLKGQYMTNCVVIRSKSKNYFITVNIWF